MAGRGARLRLSAGAVALLAACGGPERGRERPLVRIADTVAAAHGLGEPATATVDHTTRYTLSQGTVVAMSPLPRLGFVEVGADGSVELPLLCPADLAGRRLVAELGVRLGVMPDGALALPAVRQVEEVRCPAGEDAAPRLRLEGLRRGLRIYPSLRGFLPATEPRVETPPISVPPRARLRLGMAIADPRPPDRRPAARFVLRARDAAGRVETLLERTLDPARRDADRSWVDAEVALDGVRERLGGELRLVFETEPIGAADAVAYPAWGDPILTVPVPADAPRRPNVVIVSIDTLRADRLGCYGDARPTSPRLDQLARESTLFEQAIAPANWTMPSHATMLTGLAPCVHDKITLDAAGPLAPGIVPLAAILRDQGYATAAFTEDGHLDPDTFQRGFDTFRADTATAGTDPTGLVEDTLGYGLAWLREHAQDEVFLFLHTYQVHAPYTPPEPYRTLLAPDAPPGAELGGMLASSALYDAEVRYTDDVLGRFLDALVGLGLEEGTILLVTSDHGEEFGEHGGWFHGGSLYDEQIHVPMLWRMPGRAGAGRRVQEVVGLADVVPTVLDLLGIAAPTPGLLDGRSLRPSLEGTRDPDPDRMIVSANPRGDLALRASTWKVLYDLKEPPVSFWLYADPREEHPSPGAPLPAAEVTHGAYLAACAERRQQLAKAGAAPAPAPPDLDRERKLRDLGYVE